MNLGKYLKTVFGGLTGTSFSDRAEQAQKRAALAERIRQENDKRSIPIEAVPLFSKKQVADHDNETR